MELDRSYEIREKHRLRPPSRWGVKFYNDDITSFEDVMWIMCNIFKLDILHAFDFTNRVHKEGSAIIGNYDRDMAETKVDAGKHRVKEIKKPVRVEAVKLEEDDEI